MNEISELLTEKAVLQCAIHALVHTVSANEGPNDALRHFDNLSRGWLADRSNDECDHFSVCAAGFRKLLIARINSPAIPSEVQQ